MTIVEPASKIVNSTIMTAIARLSMVLAIPIICGLGALYYNWQQGERAAIQSQVTTNSQAIHRAADKLDDVNDRLIAVETKQARDTEASRRFQQEMLTRQDKIQEAIVGLSNSVSALTATVRALAEAKNSRGPP